MDQQVCEVIVTASDAEWLARYTRSLVEKRLCACGHNIAPIRSIYRWEGNIYDEPEARVALHTRVDLVSEIVADVKQNHSYDLACTIAIPIFGGSSDYIAWIIAETREPGSQ